MQKTEINKILKKYKFDPTQIISILHDIQKEENYLPEEDLRIVAGRLKVDVSRIYSIASFYRAFSLERKGRHQINVCVGTACHVRGARMVVEEIERKFDIKAGGTTKDYEYSLDTVNCVGACALGPVVIIDGEYYGGMSSAKVGSMLKRHKKKVIGN